MFQHSLRLDFKILYQVYEKIREKHWSVGKQKNDLLGNKIYWKNQKNVKNKSLCGMKALFWLQSGEIWFKTWADLISNDMTYLK